MSETLRAVVYVAGHLSDIGLWRDRCLTHCVTRGYEIAAVVTGSLAAWIQVQQMIADDEASVIVTSSLEDLPLGRLPRLEEAGTPVRHEIGDIIPTMRRAKRTRHRSSDGGIPHLRSR